jgi:hypothetical protein
MVIITMDIPGASKVTLQYSMVLGHRRGLHGACTPPARVGSRRAGAWQEGARPSKLLGGVQQLVLSFVQEEEEHGSWYRAPRFSISMGMWRRFGSDFPNPFICIHEGCIKNDVSDFLFLGLYGTAVFEVSGNGKPVGLAAKKFESLQLQLPKYFSTRLINLPHYVEPHGQLPKYFSRRASSTYRTMSSHALDVIHRRVRRQVKRQLSLSLSLFLSLSLSLYVYSCFCMGMPRSIS